MSDCNCNSISIPKGDNGWSPVLAVHTVDDITEVLQITGWIGGTGSSPVIPSNPYIGNTGFVAVGDAINIRGTNGFDGDTGVIMLFEYNNLTGVGNDSSIGASTLATYTIPAFALNINGDELEIDIYYNYVNNDQVTINLKFGGSTIYSYNELGSLDTNNSLKINIARITASSQLWTINKFSSSSNKLNSSLFVDQTNSTVDLTASNIFLIEANNLSVGANQVILKKMVIKKFQA